MPEPNATPTDIASQLKIHMQILRRRWPSVFLSLFVVLVLATVYTMRQDKIYEASASVIIEQNAPHVLGNVREVYNLGTGSYWSDKDYYGTQYKVITSRAVAERVVTALGLRSNLVFLSIERLSKEDQQAFLAKPLDIVEIVRDMLVVEPEKNSRLVYIKARHRDPQWASRLANATVNAYIDYNLQTRRDVTMKAVGWLSDKAAPLQKKRDEAEEALYAYKQANDILTVSMEDRLNITNANWQTLNQKRSELQVKRIELQSKRQQLLDVRQSKQALDSIDRIVGNSLIQQLKASYFKVIEQKAEIESKYKEEHPKLVAIEEKLRVVQESLQREMDTILANIELEYQALLNEEKALAKELDTAKAEVTQLDQKYKEFSKLKEQAQNANELYQNVVKRQEETALAAHQETSNVYKLDVAIEPKFPLFPRVRLIMALAALLGLLLGVVLAYVLNYLDNTVLNQQHVEQILQLPFLGAIPSIELEEADSSIAEVVQRDRFLLSHPKSSVAEACRTMRTNLLFMSTERLIKKVLLTSALPQEGKSTMSINLAVTMAQSGSSVLLVDTDMRRPRLQDTFGVQRNDGLTTLVLGETKINQVLHQTQTPGLDFLPCGPIPPNPTELLHTKRFANFVAEMESRYDFIIFDSPPVLAVADTLVLSKFVDGTIMIIKSGFASRDEILMAKKMLDNVNAKCLGAVLNDQDRRSRHSYYGYRYGEYYGQPHAN